MTAQKDARYGAQPALRLVRAADFGTGRKPRSPHGKITDAAIALGVDPRTLSDALHGRRVPVAELKIALAELLGVSLEECWTPKLLYAHNTGPKGGAHHHDTAPHVDA